MGTVIGAVKKVGYFLLLFVFAITVGPALRREFLPQEGLLPALGNWIASLDGPTLLGLGAVVLAMAFWLGRQLHSRG